MSPELLYAPYSAVVLSNGGQRILPSGELLVFSGITLLNNKITIGLDEITADTTFETLASGYGNYNLVFAGKDALRISTDYFNFSRWFYKIARSSSSFAIGTTCYCYFYGIWELSFKLTREKQ